MKQNAGFTVVELLVVIVILGILLTLAVVNLTSGQVGARDEERENDVTIIASNLETFYSSGNGALPAGSYPGVDQRASDATLLTALRDLEPATLRAPGLASGISLVPATNAIATTAGVLPQPTNTTYVYQPLLNGSLCATTASKCRSFVLYYKSESTNTVIAVKSKNQ